MIKDGHIKTYFKGIISILLLTLCVVGCQRSKAGMTVAGSTSVEPFAELLAEEYMSHYPKYISMFRAVGPRQE